MKKKDIYEVTLKIVGIIAAWKFIECIIASVVVYITFQTMSTNLNINLMGVSQTNYNTMYFVFIALYGLFAYLFLFQTDKILNLLRLSDSTEVTLQIGKKTIYHIAVLLFGFFMFVFSAHQLMSNTYSKTEGTSTQQTTQQLTNSQSSTGENTQTLVSTSTSPSTTSSMTINYVNILLILLSILIIIKSEKFSGMLMPKEKEELIPSPSLV
jgi:hypothetical protein